MKIYFSVLFFCYSLFVFKVRAADNTIILPSDTGTAAYRLWRAISIDTLPYHISHDNTEKLAISSFLTLLASNGKDTTHRPTLDEIRFLYARAYYHNLLAQKDSILNFFEQNIPEQYPGLLKDLNGHFGLRRYLSCYNDPSDSCQAIQRWGLSFIQKAADSSTLMPREQWAWLAKSIEHQLPYQSFLPRLEKVLYPAPTAITGKDWEGAVLSFSRLPGKKNLLYSDGSRFPLKVLEWDESKNDWIDQTDESGLSNYPGGYRLYSADINADGFQDLIILRSASSRMSPAKLFPSVLLNDGKGKFQDISLKIGLDKMVFPQCACVGDINHDGLPDMYFGGLRDQSLFLVQNPDGSFTNNQRIYGLNEFRQDVQDCAFTDWDQDGKTDLILSLSKSNNKILIQDETDDTHRTYFDNRTEKYDMGSPTYGGAILNSPWKSNPESILFLSNISERYDILPYILAQTDTVIRDSSFLIIPSADKIQKTNLPKELALYRAGVWVNTWDGGNLVYSGGKTTESIMPYFEYRLGDTTVQIAQNQDLPIYVNSATIIEQNGLPIILFKGGGDYPIMKSTIRQLYYRPDTTGSYHRIFHLDQVHLGDIIRYQIIDKKGHPFDRSLLVQANDSRGNHAMQEWIWLPAGYTIQVLTIGSSEIKNKKD